jgi:hypothetical protein
VALTRLPARLDVIPVKYLTDSTRCSDAQLMEYQLARLAEAADLDKEIRQLTTLYLRAMDAASFCIWLREHRQELLHLMSSISTEPAKDGIKKGVTRRITD